MERQSSMISAPFKAPRRRSAITIIVPGEETNPFQKDISKTVHMEDCSTFESFKAKPRCPTPDFDGAAHEGEHIHGLPTGAGARMPHPNGNNAMGTENGVWHHNKPRATAQAPVPQGDGTPALLPQVPPSPKQQRQPKNQSLRGAASNRLADMHLFPLAPSSTATSMRKAGTRHKVNPVVAASAPSHASLLGATKTEDDTSRRLGAPVSSTSESRRSVAENSIAFSSAPVLSSSDEMPPRTSRRIRSSSRLSLHPASAHGATAGLSGNSKSKSGAAPASARPLLSSAGSTASNMVTAIGVHGTRSGLPSPQLRSAPPLQPNTMFNTAARRQSFPSSYASMPSDATDSSRGDYQGVSYSSSSRRSTMPQSRVPHDINLARVPRPHVRRRQQELLAASSRNEVREAESKFISDGLSSPFPSHSVSERGNSNDCGSSSGNTEYSNSSSVAGDLSVVISDSDLASAVSLASAFAARAPPRQRSESPLADLSNLLAPGVTTRSAAVPEKYSLVVSPPASLSDVCAVNGSRSSNGKEAEEHDADSTRSVDVADLPSTTDFPVLMGPPRFLAAASERQGKLTTVSSRPLNANSGSNSVDGIRDEQSDASISNFSLLPNDDSTAPNVVISSSPITNVAPASPLSPKFTHVQERTRRARGSTVLLPSPVDLNSLVFWKENERSISSPLASYSKHRAHSASRSGSTKGGSSGGGYAHDGEGGKGSAAVHLETDSNRQETVTKPNTRASSGGHASLFQTRKRNEDGAVDATGDSTLQLSALRTGSRGPASGPPDQVAQPSSAVACLTAAEKERWSVTQSLSIDADLFSFSQLPQEKRGSMVAKLRNMFESSTEKHPRSSSSQAGSLIATPSPTDQGSPMRHVSSLNSHNNGNSSSSAAKSSSKWKTEDDSRKASPSLWKEVGDSSQRPISLQCHKSSTAAPPVANCSSPLLFPRSPTVATSEKGALPPLTSTVNSGRVSGAYPQSSHTNSDCTATGNSATPPPRVHHAKMDLQHEASSVKNSVGMLSCISPQASDPGFSLACFKVSNVSADTVNMFDRGDF
ncbi:hypothetical protein LMJF_31_2140 [Leishmania major strain Friedlin]|uniref:Uncharacterized protein n=1 Tax=Leishmania major TaxID=5664 RepID=Q4Q647_LEIMA|nr:hypothetical protein LMJF_31_2140 [Leishmania major strain Friedlin]CAG9579390.1 hypothetical_protein_-_conserved [Leishmania major strain Friedlin]CAJ08403.1 hypothetical protein LMJF_31_2140 [Leishmania major strain Friedlin]|eukprot:XP_001685201.1 hypothetical protein LMJF_31_2140 [Leishmania major strain Friedlin]